MSLPSFSTLSCPLYYRYYIKLKLGNYSLLSFTKLHLCTVLLFCSKYFFLFSTSSSFFFLGSWGSILREIIYGWWFRNWGLFRSRGGEEGSIDGLSRLEPNIPRQKQLKGERKKQRLHESCSVVVCVRFLAWRRLIWSLEWCFEWVQKIKDLSISGKIKPNCKTHSSS